MLLLSSCASLGIDTTGSKNTLDPKTGSSMVVNNSRFPDNPNLNLTFDTNHLKEIYLAGGCFWGVEAYMARVYGVYDATSGYANGDTENPTYEEVCTDET
ncbi:MAG: peptide-methionine (S)-S-oxide reductase, partial [Vallitaleaceae bacterium]|nr:peptide-methionine (S)-S-oxide reductase [Vallitaleaceae bacterium]